MYGLSEGWRVLPRSVAESTTAEEASHEREYSDLAGTALSEQPAPPCYRGRASDDLRSVLGLELCLERGLLRLYDPAVGTYLPTADEETARADSEAARAETIADEARRRVAELEAALRAARG